VEEERIVGKQWGEKGREIRRSLRKLQGNKGKIRAETCGNSCPREDRR
jgi:hypothetical protein